MSGNGKNPLDALHKMVFCRSHNRWLLNRPTPENQETSAPVINPPNGDPLKDTNSVEEKSDMAVHDLPTEEEPDEGCDDESNSGDDELRLAGPSPPPAEGPEPSSSNLADVSAAAVAVVNPGLIFFAEELNACEQLKYDESSELSEMSDFNDYNNDEDSSVDTVTGTDLISSNEVSSTDEEDITITRDDGNMNSSQDSAEEYIDMDPGVYTIDQDNWDSYESFIYGLSDVMTSTPDIESVLDEPAGINHSEYYLESILHLYHEMIPADIVREAWSMNHSNGNSGSEDQESPPESQYEPSHDEDYEEEHEISEHNNDRVSDTEECQEFVEEENTDENDSSDSTPVTAYEVVPPPPINEAPPPTVNYGQPQVGYYYQYNMVQANAVYINSFSPVCVPCCYHRRQYYYCAYIQRPVAYSYVYQCYGYMPVPGYYTANPRQ